MICNPFSNEIHEETCFKTRSRFKLHSLLCYFYASITHQKTLITLKNTPAHIHQEVRFIHARRFTVRRNFPGTWQRTIQVDRYG